jgi:hypothetical protein
MWMMLILVGIECGASISMGYYDQLNSVCAGIVMLVHIQCLCSDANSWKVKIKGAILGLFMVYVQWQTSKLTDFSRRSII